MAKKWSSQWLTWIASALLVACGSSEPSEDAGPGGLEETSDEGGLSTGDVTLTSGSTSAGEESSSGSAAAEESGEGDESGPSPPATGGISGGFDGDPTHSRFVRLTHAQWEASVRDLLGLEVGRELSSAFIGDAPAGTFSNNERSLVVVDSLWSDYQRAAETLAASVVDDATALAHVTHGVRDGAAFIEAFGRRAFRRPLTISELERFTTLFAAASSLLGSGDPFADGVQVVLEAMLQSPHFVYRAELGAPGERLSGYELATKISLLLRGTMPDDALLAAAEQGELDTDEGVAEVAEALLETPEAARTLARFYRELLRIDRYESIIKSPEVFPNYDTAVNTELLAADVLFFEHLVADELGLRDLLLSTTGFVNERTAPLYGLSHPGAELQPVDLGPSRTGFFTRAGFLALNGTLHHPDPIHRGVDVVREIMCFPLGPPPVVIPPLPPPQTGQTNRERVEAHTGPGTCGSSCHAQIINPVGFAFENFDAIGSERALDNGLPVDTSGALSLSDGVMMFEDAPELMRILAESEQAHACYAQHVTEFVLARALTEDDRAQALTLMDESKQGRSFKELVMMTIASPSFTTRNEASP